MSRSLYYQPIVPPPPGTSLGGHPVKGLLMDAFDWHDDGTVEIELAGPECDAVLAALGRIEAAKIARLVGTAPSPAVQQSQVLQDARECFEALEELRSALRQHPDGLRLYLAD